MNKILNAAIPLQTFFGILNKKIILFTNVTIKRDENNNNKCTYYIVGNSFESIEFV